MQELIGLLLPVHAVFVCCREVGLLKINVERAEWDVLAGVIDQDWPKVRKVMLYSPACHAEVYGGGVVTLQQSLYDVTVEWPGGLASGTPFT